ncbi:MAG TPA: ChbG/HpnK family deacetylase [Caldimonas sp.]|nr:ChbG/HpnK family deacetylase [Caldimonas sp.]
MSRSRARVLGVCVDDVGLLEGVADTVVALAAAGRISAASCVTNAPAWRGSAALLAASTAPLETGLHFNLSEGVPLSPDLRAHWPALPGLARLLAQAHLRRLPLAAIGAEFAAQVDAFAAALGRLPAFIDGHQHVHALPGVRRVVLDAIATWPKRPAVRSTARVLGPGAGFKGRVIEASGGRALARELDARGIAHNAVLLGAYDFGADYRPLMRAWLAATPDAGGLLFCHPRAGAVRADDPIAAARRREADYLASDDFRADLDAAGVTVGAAWPTRSSSAG